MGLLINEIQGRSTYNSSTVYRFYNPNLYWPTNFTPSDIYDYGTQLLLSDSECVYPDCIEYEDNVNNDVPCFGECPGNDCFCLGDTNGDGALNILDVVSTVNTILGNSPFDSDDMYLAADFNQDGQINVLDVIGMIRCILKLECPYYEREYIPYGIVDGIGYFNIINWPHAPEYNTDTINLLGYKIKLVNYDNQNQVDCECEINQDLNLDSKHATTIFTDGSLNVQCGGFCFHDNEQGYGLRIPFDLQSRQAILIEDTNGTAVSNMSWDLSTMSPFEKVTECKQNINSNVVENCESFDTISNGVSWPLDVSLAINMEGEGANFNFSEVRLELDSDYPYDWHLACYDYVQHQHYESSDPFRNMPYLNNCGFDRPNPSGRTMYGLHRSGCSSTLSRNTQDCCLGGDENCGSLELMVPESIGHSCSFAGYCFDNNDCCPQFINCCDVGIPAESEIIISYMRNGDI